MSHYHPCDAAACADWGVPEERVIPEAARRDLAALAHSVRHLNQPMLTRLHRCAEDTSPNWDERFTIHPGEAEGLVALIDCAAALGVGPWVPVSCAPPPGVSRGT